MSSDKIFHYLVDELFGDITGYELWQNVCKFSIILCNVGTSWFLNILKKLCFSHKSWKEGKRRKERINLRKRTHHLWGKWIFFNKINIINEEVEKIHTIKWERAAKTESEQNRKRVTALDLNSSGLWYQILFSIHESIDTFSFWNRLFPPLYLVRYWKHRKSSKVNKFKQHWLCNVNQS